MTKLEKLYSIIENSRDVGVKLPKGVLQQVEELEEGIIKEEPEEVKPHEPTKHIENVTKGIKVTFPDGTVIWHRQAIDTFIDALRKIGLERIPAVGIQHGNGYNLVSKDKRPTMPGRIWQHECDGWYIYSNISNGTKAEDLKRISNHYHLGLKIEEGKP